MSISFHFEGVDKEFFPIDEKLVLEWVEGAISEEEKTVGEINYVFCDDSFLLEMNQSYLNHDTLTDIITFPYNYNPIETDIYISIDRVKDNADSYNQAFRDELLRVIIHGILHMIGYDDKTSDDKLKMREKENYYLDKI